MQTPEQREQPFTVLFIAGSMVVIFFLQLLLPITDVLALNASEFFQEPWTILTAGFAHSSFSHLFGNMFFLVFFGLVLERLLGSERFFYLLLLSIAVANIAAFIYYPQTQVLGASGAVSTFLVALAIFQPRMVGIYMGIPMRMWAVLLIWFLYNLAQSAVSTQIAAEAHLFGGAFGIIVGIWLRREAFSRPQPEPHRQTDESDISEETIEEWERRHMH